LVSSSLKEAANRGIIQLLSLFLLCLSLISFGLSKSFPLALIFLFLAGVFETLFVTTNIILLLYSVPDSLRGRVSGIQNLKVGLIPISAFIAGIGADHFGPNVVTIIFGFFIGLIALIVFFAFRKFVE
jgi:sugar phosphate permease